MRSVAEIQADIDKVSVELAQAQRELEQYEASATEEQKAQDADPEWRLARQRYIDTGDMSGVNGWYNRRDQRKRDELDRKRYEQEQARLEAERKKDKESILKKLEREAIDSEAAYNDIVPIYNNDKSPANLAAMNGAKRKRDWAIQDYIKAGGDPAKFHTEPADGNDNNQGDGKNNYVDNTDAQVEIERKVNDLVQQAKILREMKYDLRKTTANMAKAPKQAEYDALVKVIDGLLADDRVSRETKEYLNNQKTTLQDNVRGWTDQSYKDNGGKWPDWEKPAAGGGTGGGSSTGEKVVKKEVAKAAADQVTYSPSLRQDAQSGKTVTLYGVQFTLSYDKGTRQIILKNGSNKFTLQAQ